MPTGRKLWPDRPHDPRGTVYLLHAEGGVERVPGAMARHYLGWTQNLEERLERHAVNGGSSLVAEWNRLGIKWKLVRTWENVTRREEFRLKNWGKARKLCPCCREREGLTGKLVRIRGQGGRFMGSRRTG